MAGAKSSARAWSGAHRRWVVAVRERAWKGFCDAVTRSQMYRADWRYIRLAGAYEDQWPESGAIFQEHFEQVIVYLEGATFERGWGSMTFAEYDA